MLHVYLCMLEVINSRREKKKKEMRSEDSVGYLYYLSLQAYKNHTYTHFQVYPPLLFTVKMW